MAVRFGARAFGVGVSEARTVHVLAVGPFQSQEVHFTGLCGRKGSSGLALDDLDDRFAAAVKVALGGARGPRNDESDTAEGSECPSADVIASYYEHGLGRVDRVSLETHFSRCARCQG